MLNTKKPCQQTTCTGLGNGEPFNFCHYPDSEWKELQVDKSAFIPVNPENPAADILTLSVYATSGVDVEIWLTTEDNIRVRMVGTGIFPDDAPALAVSKVNGEAQIWVEYAGPCCNAMRCNSLRLNVWLPVECEMERIKIKCLRLAGHTRLKAKREIRISASGLVCCEAETKHLQVETSREGIQVTAICPEFEQGEDKTCFVRVQAEQGAAEIRLLGFNESRIRSSGTENNYHFEGSEACDGDEPTRIGGVVRACSGLVTIR